MTNGPEPLGMKVCVTPLGKEPRPAEVLATGQENTEWVVEKEVLNTTYDPVISYRKEN